MLSWLPCTTVKALSGCSVGVFRRHPPEDMDDVVPRLSSVAAEIETPGQSPRSGLASPNAGILQSGDSFTKAFMHQARRLRTAVLHQKVGALHLISAHAFQVLLTMNPP